MMVYYIVTVIGLLVFEVVLKLAMVTRVLPFILQGIMQHYGQGLSAVNLANPGMFEYSPSKRVTKAMVNGKERFSLDIAEFLLLISAVVYERNDDDIKFAYDLYKDHRRHPNYGGTDDEVSEEIHGYMDASLDAIKRLSSGWGMKFDHISELNIVGAPFASLWWNEKEKFIVVAFKGTTPWDYTEWITDATYQKKEVESNFFPPDPIDVERDMNGKDRKGRSDVHAGFYDALFPHKYGDTPKNSPYGCIIDAVKEKIKELTREGDGDIPVWVTGHSLGAGYASLFYASLKSCLAYNHNPLETNDPDKILLGSKANLMDAYVFGCPAVGDLDFARQFDEACRKCMTADDGRNLGQFYRVVNDLDPVTRVPFSWFNVLEFTTKGKPNVGQYPKMYRYRGISLRKGGSGIKYCLGMCS
ncbi:alpha/beta-hydrolase [Saitoella complicata NRRL Y-17804]|uniref:alpha/beta-hydrolase n=1 Tax=Saitoella complicata (strain BCRC 22490 / CBS 7301 / JCM 7358 / NBRC 10748 / NRRL Y-17804) TaxID=698492 RepID=UPI0008679982|nr:alpha/beta-hydrolase [Saitoella complicata NRRL Y-17804]ODQ51811.1 alpha/beta-hydrolase [Saitoella complicata NRRL Y-17804]